ncbi:thioredoxin fold domain-containing protein [Thalassotalea sp. ND16A]|uniref:thioredoxin fold domain-containing protein n=1 Tax=Thalassotalea sp. ND16A TaxID=1535422 RepID=UPI000519FE4B|nr:thioredoxin fold domain-containing protein [Thalassotalea sp. ND16A]KGJ99081.1 hypothetical protein ND16A_0382 [Thalassotalea sp. ND16A]
MFRKYLIVISLLFINCSVTALAWENEAIPASKVAQYNAEMIKTKLSSLLGLKINSVTRTPMPGVAELATDQGLFYTSYDGEFLIQGQLFGLGNNIENLTELSLAKVRVKGLKDFENDMIVYPAKNEKHVINVFTDITCGYCRKMHGQMDAYNDLGITVRYLAYPRAGIMDREGEFTSGYKDLRSVWCHEVPSKALTNAKQGASVVPRVCDKPVAEEFNFGRQVGVNSTPTIITSNGTMMPGYRKPEELLAILESM